MNIPSAIKIGLMPEASPADKKRTTSATTPEEARLRQACQGFEAIITRHLFASMRRAASGDDGITGKSFAKDMYESMRDDILATKISRNNHFGLAEVLYRQLSGTLNAHPAPVAASRSIDEVA